MAKDSFACRIIDVGDFDGWTGAKCEFLGTTMNLRASRDMCARLAAFLFTERLARVTLDSSGNVLSVEED